MKEKMEEEKRENGGERKTLGEGLWKSLPNSRSIDVIGIIVGNLCSRLTLFPQTQSLSFIPCSAAEHPWQPFMPACSHLFWIPQIFSF